MLRHYAGKHQVKILQRRSGVRPNADNPVVQVVLIADERRPVSVSQREQRRLVAKMGGLNLQRRPLLLLRFLLLRSERFRLLFGELPGELGVLDIHPLQFQLVVNPPAPLVFQD